jgi:glyoxalase-like protein
VLKGAMVVGALICLSSCQSMSPPEQPLALPAKIDHIVYATPDLDQGIREIEDKLGVKATLGGQHPGRGTRNALISLGPSTYLEIFAPDPGQPAPKQPRAFGLDNLKNSKARGLVREER